MKVMQRWSKKETNTSRDITIDEFEKITDYFARIQFCGQYSDPIHHPHFIDFLRIIKRKDLISQVHTASNYKSDAWFKEAFVSILIHNGGLV